MAQIFKRSNNKTEFVEDAKPLTTFGANAHNRLVKPVQESTIAPKLKNGVRGLKTKNSTAFKAGSKRIKNLLQKADEVLFIRKVVARNPLSLVSEFKRDLNEELVRLQKYATVGLRKNDVAKCLIFTQRIQRSIEKLREYERTLEEEKSDRHASREKSSISRKITAEVAKRHRLGDVVGKTNVTEYAAPGSTLWATPRKSKK